MILHSMILSFSPSAFRIFAPFLHHFCTMKCNFEDFAVKHPVKFHQNRNTLFSIGSLQNTVLKTFFW